MNKNMGSIQTTMAELIAQKEAIVLDQIIQLVKDGILVVEESEGHIFRDENSANSKIPNLVPSTCLRNIF